MSAESDRVAKFGGLEDGLRQASEWYLWGPYLSERQWGTVREDYSEGGDARNTSPTIRRKAIRSQSDRPNATGLTAIIAIL